MRQLVWIPIACLPMFYFLFDLALFNFENRSRRSVFVLATCAWSALLVVIVELLGLVDGITPGPLVAAWCVCLMALLAGFVVVARRRKTPVIRPLLAWLRDSWEALYDLHWVSALSVAVVAFIAASTAMVAYLYIPNNADSIGYHMPRVMHWLQQANVSHFATNWFPEVQYGPFAEFVILNFEVIQGRDFLANLVQWFSMIVCVVGVSNITARLGGNRDTQIVAALLCISLPSVILQSTSNQNDLVVAFTLVCFVDMGLAMLAEKERAVWWVGLGLSLGLGLLTKATALLYFLPFVVWFGVELLRAWGWRAFRVVGVVFVTSVTLNAGYFARNLALYGSPIGPSRYFLIEDWSLGAYFSVAIRNVAGQLQFGDPESFFGHASQQLLNWLRMLHELTTRSTGDARISMTPQYDGFRVQAVYFDDIAGNPLQFGLLGVAIVLGAAPRVARELRVFLVCVVVGIASANLLKWQVWGSRLVLAVLVLACVVVALVVFSRAKSSVIRVVPLLVAVASLSWLFGNVRRPISETALYSRANRGAFNQTSEYYGNADDYLDFADRVQRSGCGRVGLVIEGNLLEYPIWRAFRERGYSGRIEHLNPDAETRHLSVPNFAPCAVISEKPLEAFEGVLQRSEVPSHARYAPRDALIYFYVGASPGL